MNQQRIILAFWQPRQQRFCELTADEILARSGASIADPEVKSLQHRGIILSEDVGKGFKVYGLSNAGKTLARRYITVASKKPRRILTAIPHEDAK